MITLYVREHGTHNSGYSFDFIADLNDYTSQSDLLDNLYEYTRNELEKREDKSFEDDLFEEWLITDWEFEDDNFGIKFNEYASIEKLININIELEELSTEDKKLLSAYIDATGVDFDYAFSKVKEGDIYSYDGSLEDWAYQMVEEGLFGEVNEKLINYIDYEKLARDISMDGYYHSEKFDISFHYD